MTRPRVHPRLLSVIIPSWNTRDVTAACIARVRAHTPAPAEIVVVDNGSTDGSPELLDALARAPHPIPLRVVRNETNRGYACATNQGIQLAHGRWLVLLNSDVLVTPGWSVGLLQAARDRRVGLVGPITNHAGSVEQSLRAAPRYGSEAELDAFAERWRQTHRNERTTVERLVGFCLLVRRSVVERIGLLDERFGLGNFEDDDYCVRARVAGFSLVVAREVFVHHYGSLSFRANRVDHHATMQRNAVVFREKHGPTVLRRAPRQRISLCMIARDEGATLARCLASTADVVDEVIVVDTGSIDDTAAIATAHGATVVQHAWTDDFAAARNVARERASGQWILALDADEELPPDTRARLRDAVDRAEADGLEVPIQNLRAGGAIATVHVALRLFRNLPAHRYVGRVHERVRVARCAAAWLPIVHHGYADPGTLRTKLARNRTLLERAAAEDPGEPLLRYYLAATALLSGDHEQAVRFAEEGLGLASPARIDARMLCLQALGLAQLARGKGEAAEAAWTDALALCPDWIDARLQLGLFCQGAGRPREAIAHLGRFLVDRQALAHDTTWPLRFPVLTSLLEEPTARARLAATYASLGMFDAAQREAARALTLSPERTDVAHLLARIRAERARPWRSRHDARC